MYCYIFVALFTNIKNLKIFNNNYYKNQLKSSTLKIYFNAAAEGNVGLLRKIHFDHPGLFNYYNKNTEHKAIYYAVKNQRKEATLYLLELGSRLSHKELNRLITFEWYGSLASFYFLLDVGPSLMSESNGLSHIDFKKWLKDKYLITYYTHRNIDRLVKFLESIGDEIDWQKYLDDFTKYSGPAPNKNTNHLKFIRELKLKTIL